ncbi:MAG: DinB family protein [Candidatus Bathyarchaeota archaeon]
MLTVVSIELIRYVHAARRRYLKAFSELPWAEVVKDRGASFPSIRDIFLHALNQEDRLINYVIPGNAEKWSSEEPGKFLNMQMLEEYVDKTEKKVDAYLANVAERELDNTVEVPRRQGPPLQRRIEDILIQVATENIYHLGEMEAIFYQLDKQAPFINWSAFLDPGT